jgi:hypothetical protein
MRVRRAIALVLVAGLVAGVGTAADAKKKKKKPPKPKTVETQLFFHGTLPLGELEANVVSMEFLPMDPTPPSGTEMKSYGITNYTVGPNTACAGNNLFPVWLGDVAGTIVGDLTLSISTLGQAATLEIRVWPDVNATLCDSNVGMDYVEPAASGIVDVPAGEGSIEAVLGPASLAGNSFEAGLYLMVQISPLALGAPFVSRVLYDTAAAPSSLTFQCIPPKGETACA